MFSRIGAVAGLVALSVMAPWSLAGEPAPAVPAPVAAPTPIDVNSVREKVSPGTCLVTVLNSWGLPVAYVNGFLLGQGRFVVTDLGAVGQPGVASVSFKLWSGVAATAKEFGFADTSTGLVALKIEAESPSPGGLELASEAPPVSTLPTTATVGWPWSKESGVSPGHLIQAPPAKDLAQRCGITAPEGPDVFLRVEGVRFEAASGAPIVNAQGAVVAVRTDLAGRGLAISLAAQAAPFRTALLSAQPQVKPLSELPKPVWPVRLLRLPGEPPAPAEFAKATQAVRTGMVCPTCNGKPQTQRERDGPGHGPPGWGWGCGTCRGEGIAFTAPLKTLLSEMALEGTRGLWAPVADDRTRTVVRATAHEVLKVLTLAAERFQTSMATGFWSDMGQWPAGTLPRGGVFCGEVREAIDGPDGKYVLLKPQRAREVVAIRADLLAEATTKATGTKELLAGTQVALLGAAVGRFRMPAGEHGIYVLPLDWLPTPGLTVSMPEFGMPRGFDHGGDRGGNRPDGQRPPGTPGTPPAGGNGR
jgi:hypothetical protein